LKGIGEEPFAEDHFVINAIARESIEYPIIVKNPYEDKEVIFKVETDLLNSSGKSKVKLGPG